MRFKTAILFLLTLIGAGSISGQSVRFYQIDDLEDYTRVLELSVEEQRLMFFVIFKDNGGFEEMIRGGVFRDDSLKNTIQDFIPVAIYRSSEMASRLMESFGEKTLPTFYVMNQEEFLLNAAYGKQTEADMIDFLIASSELSKQLQVLREKYQKHKLTNEQWVMLIGLYELNFDYLSTQDLAFEFLTEVPDSQILSDIVKPVSLSYGIGLETPYAERILRQKDALDSAEFADFYASSYSFNLDLASENKDTSLLHKILRELLPYAAVSDSMKQEMVLETQILFARESGLFEVWQEAVIKYCDNLHAPAEKAEFAFDQAYTIAEEFNSESAQEATRNLAEKASLWKPDYRYYMLEAYMAYIMKDYDDGLQIVDKALALAENEKDAEKASRLKNMIESDKGVK